MPEFRLPGQIKIMCILYITRGGKEGLYKHYRVVSRHKLTLILYDTSTWPTITLVMFRGDIPNRGEGIAKIYDHIILYHKA